MAQQRSSAPTNPIAECKSASRCRSDLVAVSNGRLKKTDHDVAGKKKTFHWEVVNPINNYGVNVNIGNYVNLL